MKGNFTMKTVIALMLAFAASAFAQPARRPASQNTFASDFQTVPVMANVTGQGNAKFESYVSILNPTSSAFAVDVTLYDANGNTHEATINLAAGEMKTYANFLASVFNYNGGGAVTFRSLNGNDRFIVSTEVRTGASGNFSTPVPALEFAGSSSPSFAGGITVDANSRTNIGCFNQSSSANSVKATIFDRTGAQNLGSVTMNLAANAWGQAGIGTVVSDGYIRFEPSDNAVCYAVVVNNGTNDGRFVSATEYTP